MPTIPQKMSAKKSPFSVEWNALVDYLHAIKPIASPGTTVAITPFGTARQVVGQSQRIERIIYIRVCKTDGSEEYMPIMVAGPAVGEADIPTNAEVYDPPS